MRSVLVAKAKSHRAWRTSDALVLPPGSPESCAYISLTPRGAGSQVPELDTRRYLWSCTDCGQQTHSASGIHVDHGSRCTALVRLVGASDQLHRIRTSSPGSNVASSAEQPSLVEPGCLATRRSLAEHRSGSSRRAGRVAFNGCQRADGVVVCALLGHCARRTRAGGSG